MNTQTRWLQCLLLTLLSWFAMMVSTGIPTYAATTDPYVLRYLKVSEPIPVQLDLDGNTRLFSGPEISEGKRLFEENCKGCHVGGATLPNPMVSLSLTDLKGASPPRNTVNSLVDYFRNPVTYDGSEEAIFCRQVPDSWLSRAQVENLAAFILRAAEKAPGWGPNNF